MTKVVKVDRRNENFDVYIGRAWAGLPDSKWANPYHIGKHGTREQVLEMYRVYILNRPDLLAALPELKDKTLGCWCKPEACHGDILVELIEKSDPRGWIEYCECGRYLGQSEGLPSVGKTVIVKVPCEHEREKASVQLD